MNGKRAVLLVAMFGACSSAGTSTLPGGDAGTTKDASATKDGATKDAASKDAAGEDAIEDAAVAEDATVDAAVAQDAAPRRDAAIVDAGWNECEAPAGCSARPSFPASRFCTAPAWSCIANRCAWECGAPRTCAIHTDGCVVCDGEAPACPGEPCIYPLTPRPMVEDSTCARAFLVDVQQCYGRWVVLRDGMLCSFEPLPTGVLRAVLTCGFCQTTVVYR